MPRRKRPHLFEVLEVPFDPTTPFHLRRAVYTRLSDDDLDKISHSAQQQAVQNTFGLRQKLPLPSQESTVKLDGSTFSGPDRGYVVTVIYRDWRTGVDPKRLALKQLITDAHAGKHAGVLFRDDDRLFRGIVGGMPVAQLHEELPSYTFEAASGAFSIDDFAIHAHMSGRERDKTRQRTTAARRLRAANGEAVHTKYPYWLERDPTTRGVRLVPERAEAMRAAMRRYVAGETPSNLARWMNIHAPVGGEARAWTTDRLREAFRSPALWGRMDYGRHKEVTERRNGELFVVRRDTNPHAVPFNVPPLVHRSNLERAECQAQAGCDLDELPTSEDLDALIKSANLRTGGRRAIRPHPLRRRVVCACGWRMGYNPKWHNGQEKDYGYLVCTPTQQRGLSVIRERPPCPTPRVRSRILLPKVKALVIDAINHPDRVIAEVEASLLAEAAHEARTAAQESAELERLTLELADLDERENRAYERWDSHKISEAVYHGQAAKIAAERQVAQEAKRQLLDRQRILREASTNTAQLRAALLEAGTDVDFDAMNDERWTELITRLVADVVLDAAGEPTLRWRHASREPGQSPAI